MWQRTRAVPTFIGTLNSAPNATLHSAILRQCPRRSQRLRAGPEPDRHDDVTTDPNGNASFSASFPIVVPSARPSAQRRPTRTATRRSSAGCHGVAASGPVWPSTTPTISMRQHAHRADAWRPGQRLRSLRQSLVGGPGHEHPHGTLVAPVRWCIHLHAKLQLHRRRYVHYYATTARTTPTSRRSRSM